MKNTIRIADYTHKALAYCYPTSEGACKSGFGAVGCWMVKIVNPVTWAFIPIATFADKADALAYIETIDKPTDAYCMTLRSRTVAVAE